MALTPCSDLSAADWITDSDRPWHQLVTLGPRRFPAYARLRFIPDPAHEGQRENDAVLAEHTPSETARLRTVLETLARYTRTPDDCFFLLWDGWGSVIDGDDGIRILYREERKGAVHGETGTIRKGPQVAPAFPQSVLQGPKVVVPNREYFLFRGAVSDFGDWGAAEVWPGRPRLHMPDPAFVWPADHAWCVTNDVDPHWAGIGADVAAIDTLLADPRLDVVPADPREDQPYYR